VISVSTLFIVIATSRHVNKNVSTGAVIRAKSRVFIKYYSELSNRFRLQVQACERLVRNPILPARVYERTQMQSTQAW